MSAEKSRPYAQQTDEGLQQALTLANGMLSRPDPFGPEHRARIERDRELILAEMANRVRADIAALCPVCGDPYSASGDELRGAHIH